MVNIGAFLRAHFLCRALVALCKSFDIGPVAERLLQNVQLVLSRSLEQVFDLVLGHSLHCVVDFFEAVGVVRIDLLLFESSRLLLEDILIRVRQRERLHAFQIVLARDSLWRV